MINDNYEEKEDQNDDDDDDDHHDEQPCNYLLHLPRSHPPQKKTGEERINNS